MLFFSLPGVVAGIGEFLSSVMMTETPGYVFNSLILLIAAFTVRSGVKVMARMFVLLVGIMLALTLLVLLMAIPNYDPLFLFPFFSDGIRPVLHGAFISAGFPFGEIFLFSMVFPFVRGNGKMASVKSMYLAYGLSGSVLLLSVVCNLMAFGPATGTLKYSLYSLASVIQIADFIQRIEAIVVIALITGSYMKACIFLFILNQIMVKLLRLKDENTLVYPISLVSLMLSLTMFRTPAEFTKQVYTLWPFTVIFIGSAILFLLVIISLFKQKNRASSAKG
jgi:spore germination protein KB